MRFDDKVVWITGASSGVGEALAHAFHKEGAHVVLSARRADELLRVSGELSGGAGGRMVQPMDLADPASIDAAAADVLERFGRIDILVNNAGLTMRGTVAETEMTVFRDLMEVNYFGPLALTKRVLPTMAEHGGGRIVAISSVAAQYSTPLRAGYTASKAAAEGVFDTIRAEAWSQGIAVTNVVLGSVRTNISVNALTKTGERYGRMNKLQAAGLVPEPVAARILDAVAAGRDRITIAYPLQRWHVWRARLLPRISFRAVRLKPRT